MKAGSLFCVRQVACCASEILTKNDANESCDIGKVVGRKTKTMCWKKKVFGAGGDCRVG